MTTVCTTFARKSKIKFTRLDLFVRLWAKVDQVSASFGAIRVSTPLRPSRVVVGATSVFADTLTQVFNFFAQV